MNDISPNYTFSSVIEDAKKVISNPVEFYRNMPTAGGFINPIIFVAVMGAITGLLVAVFSLFSSYNVGGFAFSAVIFFPIIMTIGIFIGGAIMFVVWRLMGSEKDYEAAVRCVAYAYAIAPILVVLSIIPYLGTIVKTLWGCYLMFTASVEVHKIGASTAKMVFGILAALGILVGLNMEHTARNWQSSLKQATANANLPDALKEFEDMTPEETGKAVGEFIKGLQEAAEEAERASK